MKKVMFALVAIMVAGFAGAITTDWKDWQNVTNAPSGQNTTQGVTINGIGTSDFAIKVVVSGMTLKANPSGWVYLAAVSPASGDAYAVRMAGGTEDKANGTHYKTNYWYFGKGQADTPGDYTKYTIPENGTAQTFLFEYDAESKLLSIFVDDQLLGSASDVTFNSNVALAIGTQPGNGQNPIGNRLEAWNVDSVQYSTLPEPTVLALLALGVAGVALKRKVA